MGVQEKCAAAPSKKFSYEMHFYATTYVQYRIIWTSAWRRGMNRQDALVLGYTLHDRYVTRVPKIPRS